MNKQEFHISFIKSLVFVALVTLFAMASSRYVINYYGHRYETTRISIPSKSDISTKLTD